MQLPRYHLNFPFSGPSFELLNAENGPEYRFHPPGGSGPTFGLPSRTLAPTAPSLRFGKSLLLPFSAFTLGYYSQSR